MDRISHSPVAHRVILARYEARLQEEMNDEVPARKDFVFPQSASVKPGIEAEVLVKRPRLVQAPCGWFRSPSSARAREST